MRKAKIYLDTKINKALHMAYEEGKKEQEDFILDITNRYPNDMELGEAIRSIARCDKGTPKGKPKCSVPVCKDITYKWNLKAVKPARKVVILRKPYAEDDKLYIEIDREHLHPGDLLGPFIIRSYSTRVIHDNYNYKYEIYSTLNVGDILNFKTMHNI